MNFSDTFIDLIKAIESYESESSPRGLQVKESLMTSFDIDPSQPIVDFKDRPFNFKYFAGELAWYLRRDRDVDYITHFSKFWKSLTNPNTNEINSNYGNLVINNQQYGWVIDSLVKDKNSRQAIMFFNRPEYQFEGNKDFVCTLYANFFIRHDRLFMKVQMRSNDIFFGLTFDAPFFAFLYQSVYHTLKETYPDLEAGMYFHHVDNIHFYERHFELVESIKQNGKGTDYKMILKKPMISYRNGEVSLTDCGSEFIKRIDTAAKREQETGEVENYKLILQDYFEF